MPIFTDKEISKRVTKQDWLIEDAPRGHGRFMVRRRPEGERLFYFRYTDSTGNREFYPLGAYDSEGRSGLTLAEARAAAGELSRLYQSGVKDIRLHLEAKRAAEDAAIEAENARFNREKAEAERAATALAARMTVTALFDHWLSIDGCNRKDGGAELKRSFARDVLPVIGELHVEDVKKSHIMQVIDPILARGTKRMAKVTFANLRQMFSFAVERDFIEHNPTANIRKAKIGGKDNERDRVLTDDEIRLLVKALPDARLLATTETAIWITLSTCCRIGELLAARWEHVDFDLQEWMIPAENSKNGKAHTVYLSDFAAQQFRHLMKFSGRTPWVYPNTDDTGPVCSKTITKQLTDRQREPGDGSMSRRSAKTDALVLPGGKWTAHDLRRTGATLMTVLGVLPEVAERCLNHTEENKVKRIYQRHNYTGEMREAWRLLGDRLELLTRPDADNVVPMRRLK